VLRGYYPTRWIQKWGVIFLVWNAYKKSHPTLLSTVASGVGPGTGPRLRAGVPSVSVAVRIGKWVVSGLGCAHGRRSG